MINTSSPEPEKGIKFPDTRSYLMIRREILIIKTKNRSGKNLKAVKNLV